RGVGGGGAWVGGDGGVSGASVESTAVGSAGSTAAGSAARFANVDEQGVLKLAVGGTSMSHLRVVRVGFSAVLIVTMISVLGCGRKHENAAVGTAGTENQKNFAAPAGGGKGVLGAGGTGGEETVAGAFGARDQNGA